MAKGSWPKTFDTAFDTYEVIGPPLGEGGSGCVFPVQNLGNQRFALKCLSPERVTTERRKRFKNEIAFCSNYEHTNIVRVLDSGVAVVKSEKSPFYVMPQFPLTLRKLMDKGIEHQKALQLFGQLLSGMDAAHKYGVFHRDLKPENILYDPQKDLLVVADFGIAHFEEDLLVTSVKTGVNARLANLAYAAPEQRTKGAKVDHRADIFSLGFLLHELFMKVIPIGSGNKLIGSIAPELAYLDQIVELMIRNDPSGRPSTVEEVIKEMQQRGSVSIALQRLDSMSKQVVPAFAPSRAEPIKIVKVDWDEGELTIEFNRKPDAEWIQLFGQPSAGTWASVLGAGPEHFQFFHMVARVRAQENSAAQIAQHAKQYVQMANEGYQHHVDVRAAQQQRAYQEKIVKDRDAAATRARVLAQIKL